MRKPVESEAARRKGPEERDSGALAEIHEQVEDIGGQSGGEDVLRRNGVPCFRTFAQAEEERKNKTEQYSRKQGMKIGAVKSEEGGGTGEFAEQVDVGDSARDEHGNRGGTGDAGKRGTL